MLHVGAGEGARPAWSVCAPGDGAPKAPLRPVTAGLGILGPGPCTPASASSAMAARSQLSLSPTVSTKQGSH